jgi:tetratricopeptide (TPR) repeat protein
MSGVMLLVAAALLGGFAGAAQNKDKDSGASKKTFAMSQPVYEKLQKAQELVTAKEYSKGLEMLSDLRKKTNLTGYESAQIWNLIAYTHYLQERYPDAIKAYEQVLVQTELPDALVLSTLKTLSQIYFITENYPKALETVTRLLDMVEDPSADIYMLLGQAYFQMEQYQKALTPIRTAIDKYRAEGQKPKENWLLLLRAIYYETLDFEQMLGVLKELIELYPRGTYLLTLAGVYSELGDTSKQLALMESLYESGHITHAHHATNLANLYLLHNLPYKAAKVLQKEIDAKNIGATETNLRLLSQAWYQAREDKKAIPPLRQAARLSDTGELYVRLAQSHINLDQWDEAVDALHNGIGKGGIKRPGAANVMLGMALFNQQKLTSARTAFERALGDKRSAEAAQQWIAYVDSEIERRNTLRQTLLEARGLPSEATDALLENL